MAAISQNNAACPAILAALASVVSADGQQKFTEPHGLLQALMDPNQPKNSAIQQVGEGGNVRPVRVFYQQRAVESEVRNAKSCDTGTVKSKVEDNQTPTTYREIPIEVSEAALRALCKTFSDRLVAPGQLATASDNQIMLYRDTLDEVLSALPAFRRTLNTELLTQFLAKRGKWQGQGVGAYPTYYVRQALQNGNDGAPVLDGFAKLEQDLSSIGMGKPILFGRGTFDLANTALRYGCCNAAGTDFGQMGDGAGYQFYRDTEAAAVLGANVVGGFMPGYAQLLRYNQYVGDFATKHGNVQRGTFADPAIPGLRYDMRVIPSECEGEGWTIILGLHFDLWVAPAGQFAATDRLAGVNGTVTFTAGTMIPA